MEDQSGGKTAHGARPCSPGWVGNLMKLCSLCSRRTVNNSSRGRGQSLGSSIWWEFWSGSKKDLKDKLQEPFSKFPAFGCRALRPVLNYHKGFMNPYQALPIE